MGEANYNVQRLDPVTLICAADPPLWSTFFFQFSSSATRDAQNSPMSIVGTPICCVYIVAVHSHSNVFFFASFWRQIPFREHVPPRYANFARSGAVAVSKHCKHIPSHFDGVHLDCRPLALGASLLSGLFAARITSRTATVIFVNFGARFILALQTRALFKYNYFDTRCLPNRRHQPVHTEDLRSLSRSERKKGRWTA